MYEKRKPSIVDTITPLQIEAWQWCRGGQMMYGKQLYREDMHNKIILLFARGDEQNAKLDAIAAIQAVIVPVKAGILK